MVRDHKGQSVAQGDASPWVILASLVLIAVVGLGWINLKTGWFLDEIYTYGLSNSHDAPFVRDLRGGDMVDTVFTREDLNDYLTVQRGEEADVSSVIYNQQRDVHPPLYYLLVNLEASPFPDVLSKWYVLVPNLLMHLATCALLYLLVSRIFGRRWLAVGCALLYGLSRTGMETMLYVRMYVLLTTLTLVLAVQLERLLRSFSWQRCVVVGVTIFLGLLTQYYYVFYAFFACLAYDVVLLRRREFAHAALFSVLAFVGVGAFVAVWPSVFAHLFGSAGGSVSGQGVVSNLLSFSRYPSKFAQYAFFVLRGMPVAAGLFLGLLCAWPALRRRWEQAGIDAPVLPEEATRAMWVLVVPAFATILLVAVISPYNHLRYAYNVCPLFLVGLACELSLLPRTKAARPELVALAMACVATVALSVVWRPEYLHREQRLYDAALEPYADGPCVFMDDNYFAAFTAEIPQLMLFDDLYVANDASSDGLAGYVEGHEDDDHLVVFIDTFAGGSAFDAEGTAHDLAEELGYEQVQWLYGRELSQVYVLE